MAGPSSQPAPDGYTLNNDQVVAHHHGAISNTFQPQFATMDYNAEPFLYADNLHTCTSTVSLTSSHWVPSTST
jgi:hypothetical protein